MGLDKRPDAPMLEGACCAYGRAVQADLLLQRDGLVFSEKKRTADGKSFEVVKLRKHPAVEISARSWTLVKAFCSEFGLSPVSRTRLAIAPKQEPDDELSKMLAKLNAAPAGDKSVSGRIQ